MKKLIDTENITEAMYDAADAAEEDGPTAVFKAMVEAAPAVEAVPVATVRGYYAGYPVINPVNPAAVLPISAALYAHPPALDDDTRRQALELCDYFIITNAMTRFPFAERIIGIAKALREKLGAGDE